MSTNQDPDEGLILDLGIIRRSLARRLAADGIVCEQDMAVLRAFDDTHQQIGQRYQVRKAFESVMRNGVTTKTRTRTRDAGIALVIDRGQVADVVHLPESQPQDAA